MSHFLYFLGLFFFLLLKTTEKNCVLCFRCVTCATWWHGGRKWNTPCATCRRRSSTYRYNYWKRTLLEVREKKYPVIWTHQCKNLLPLTHCSAVAKAANTHSVHLKKKQFFFYKAQVHNGYIQTLVDWVQWVDSFGNGLPSFLHSTLDTCTAKSSETIVQPDIAAHTVHINGARFPIHSAQMTDLSAFHAAARWWRAGGMKLAAGVDAAAFAGNLLKMRFIILVGPPS